MHWVGKAIGVVLLLVAVLLPFVGVGVGDRGFSAVDKLVASAVLIVIALLVLILSRKRPG